MSIVESLTDNEHSECSDGVMKEHENQENRRGPVQTMFSPSANDSFDFRYQRFVGVRRVEHVAN